jgi:hypothetical protein
MLALSFSGFGPTSDIGPPALPIPYPAAHLCRYNAQSLAAGEHAKARVHHSERNAAMGRQRKLADLFDHFVGAGEQ